MTLLIFAGVALWLIFTAWHRRGTLSRDGLIKYAAGAIICVISAAFFLPGIYVVQKIIGRMLMPAGMFWGALFVGFFWFAARRDWRPAWVAGAAWCALTLSSSSYVGSQVISSLERPFGPIDVYAERPLDAILVLGGGVNGGGGYAQLSESGDRPIVAARMYLRGQTRTLITSGSSIPGIKTEVDVAASTSIIWRDLGIPDEAIVKVPAPKNTSEEMAALKVLVAERGWTRVGVVTSAFHMRRALRLAEANGLEVVALPSDFKANTVYEGLLSWIPDASGFSHLQKGCWEYLGAAVGR